MWAARYWRISACIWTARGPSGSTKPVMVTGDWIRAVIALVWRVMVKRRVGVRSAWASMDVPATSRTTPGAPMAPSSAPRRPRKRRATPGRCRSQGVGGQAEAHHHAGEEVGDVAAVDHPPGAGLQVGGGDTEPMARPSPPPSQRGAN